MNAQNDLGSRRFRLLMFGFLATVSGLVASGAVSAQSGPPAGDVTFTKDIAPILQRSCQQCHHPEGVAPMSLVTYQDVRPWARSIKMRTGLRSQRGAMPPWFVEKNIGIQKFKNDPSLNDEEVAKIAKWADSGAPQGNPENMPAPLQFDTSDKWTIGEPDLVLRSPEVIVPAVGPDRWGDIGLVPTGLTEDRYASAVEVREVNDIPKSGGTQTVGGRFVFHHMTYSSTVQGERAPGAADEGATSWPIHEVGRNADIFPADAGRLLAANSALALSAGHLHSNGRETKAHLEFAFKFFPKGYKPLYRRSTMSLGNSMDIDARPNQPNQELHAYAVLQEPTKIITFEPHMHASGVRMCMEAIWGDHIQMLNCVGYDHNWVKQYVYADDAAPLLPAGTVLHSIMWHNNTASNPFNPDPDAQITYGQRTIDEMASAWISWYFMSDEDLKKEMDSRRAAKTVPTSTR
jgi:mono/diheme cytochrome c family protein